MLELLTNIGVTLDAAITLIGISFAFLMRFTWRCGICGKLNETGMLKLLFFMCDHEGDT